MVTEVGGWKGVKGAKSLGMGRGWQEAGRMDGWMDVVCYDEYKTSTVQAKDNLTDTHDNKNTESLKKKR